MIVHNPGLDNFTVQTARTAVGGVQGQERPDAAERTGAAEQTNSTGRGQSVEEREEAESRRLEAIARREEAMENVVARSEDGDTLQVEEENADINTEDIGEVVARNGAVPIPPPPEEIVAPEVEGDVDIAAAEEVAEMAPAEGRVPGVPPEGRSPEGVSPEGRTPEGTPTAAEDEQGSLASQAQGQQIGQSPADLAKEMAEDEAARREEVRQELETRAEEQETASEEAEAQQLERETVENEQTASQASSNFIGISDSRLEQMYLRGEISRYDYQTEIDAREAEREQRQMESNNQFTQDMANIDRVGRQVENEAEAIETATAEGANDNLTAEQRLDMIENLQQNNVEEARREEDERIIWQAQFME